MIFGLEASQLPDHWTPLEAIAIIKCLDETGELALYTSTTPGLTGWEALGMLTAAKATQTSIEIIAFEPEDDDSDE